MTTPPLDGNRSVEDIALEILQEQGYRVEKDLPHEPRVTIAAQPGTVLRWAVVACTHLGGKFQQLSHLREFCDYAASQGVTDFWHVGDIVNGSSRRHDYIYENFIHGATAQHDYAAEVLPRHAGVRWRVIDGNHDEWWHGTEGVTTGRELALRRPDVEYIGRRAAWIEVGPLSVYVHHGAGGMPYALSYKQQRAIERMNPRPDVYLIANWHSALYVPGYAGCELLMAPCFQATTPFERSKGLSPTCGGFILTIELMDEGLWRVVPEFRIYKQMRDHDY